MSVDRLTRMAGRIVERFRRNEEGSVAVETVLAGAVLSVALVQLADTSLLVTDQQKLQAGAIAGADYLHGVAEDADYTAFSSDQGTFAQTRAIIKDASGLTLTDGDISFEMGCGCLEKFATGQDANGETTYRYSYDIKRRPELFSDLTTTLEPVTGQGDGSENAPPIAPDKNGECSLTCSSGDQPAVLVDIDIAYATKAMNGNDVTRAYDMRVRMK